MTDDDVPLWRLNLLRAFYLLITLGLTKSFAAVMLQHPDLWALRSIAHHYFRKPGPRWRLPVSRSYLALFKDM